MPNDKHNDGALELSFQFRTAGFRLVGMGNGYRTLDTAPFLTP